MPAATWAAASSASLRLSQGGDLVKYYPLSEEVDEYLAWRAARES